MSFNRDVIHRRREELAERGVRIRWAGRRPRLWRSVIRELEDAEQLSEDNTVLTLQFCCNYGGRAEIARRRRRDRARRGGRKDQPGQDRRAPFRTAISTSRTFRKSTCGSARPASSACRTSCSGSRPMPSWSSSTRSGPISTAGICGMPANLRRQGPPLRRRGAECGPARRGINSRSAGAAHKLIISGSDARAQRCPARPSSRRRVNQGPRLPRPPTASRMESSRHGPTQ